MVLANTKPAKRSNSANLGPNMMNKTNEVEVVEPRMSIKDAILKSLNREGVSSIDEIESDVTRLRGKATTRNSLLEKLSRLSTKRKIKRTAQGCYMLP
jgi:hypothetical protein